MLANEISEYARLLEISDTRFARADGSVTAVTGERIQLRSILDTAACVIVLFQSYLPASSPSKGKIALSPYYIASNFVYHAAKKITQYITDRGYNAVHTTEISAREAALRTGGYIGDNGFYYHDIFGSYVCIQTIITDATEPLEYAPGENKCLHCEKCKKECPSSAVACTNNCLRRHMNGIVPETLREDLYQLFGCEKCQSACPCNSFERSVPVEFSLEDILCKPLPQEVIQLAGSNVARKRRILSQAVLYAANSGAYELAEKIRELSETEEEPVRSHAQWAYEKLKGKNHDS